MQLSITMLSSGNWNRNDPTRWIPLAIGRLNWSTAKRRSKKFVSLIFTINFYLYRNCRELTRLRVGLSELPSSVLNEVEAYPWNRLLSDIGGSAGLLLGISAFTIYLQIEGTAFLEYCTLVRAFLGHALSGHNALSGTFSGTILCWNTSRRK